MDQLERLSDEFDFADAASAKLDVRRHALAPHFLLDQLLHAAQRFDRGKVQVAAIDEGPQHLQQFATGLLVTADHARLDHRVALPVAPLILVVLLQCIEAQHQRAGGTVGAQPHVDAKDEAVDGDGIQRLDQLLPQAHEEFLVVQRALGTDRLAPFRVAEDQVDVRREVQLAGTELAHAENHHVLRLAGTCASGHAELLAVALVEPAISEVDAGIGHGREVAAGFRQIGQAVEVAPDDAHLMAVAETAQRDRQRLLALAPGELRFEQRAHFALAEWALEQPVGGQLQQLPRFSANLLADEIAGSACPGEGLATGLRPAFEGRRLQVIEGAGRREERLLGTTDKGLERSRNGDQRRQAHGVLPFSGREKPTARARASQAPEPGPAASLRL